MIGGITANYEVDFKDILNLDSSNIQPEEWQLIAGQIGQMHSGYDGIVVTPVSYTHLDVYKRQS